MNFDTELVKKVGDLAKLTFDDDELETYAENITGILDFVEQMNQYDTSEISPMAHPIDITQALRSDAVTEPNQRDEVLTQAPEASAGLFLVPKVIDDSKTS